MTTSLPYVSRNGVSPVGVLAIILYTHSMLGNSSGHMPFTPLELNLDNLKQGSISTSTYSLAYGWAGEE